MIDKFVFDSRFQDLLLACIIRQPTLFLGSAGILNSAYFSGTERIATARALIAYYNKNGRFPSDGTLKQVVYRAILRTADDKAEPEIMGYIDRVLSLDTSEARYVCDEVVAWARERAVYVAIQLALTYHSTGKDPPPGGYTKLFEDALKVGVNLTEIGYRIQKDGGDIAKIIEQITDRSYGTPTGFSEFDRIWPNGWGPGWLISVIAPPKRFKTAFAINLAMNMIEKEKTPVFYYPCEISQELAAARCLCNLTELPMDKLYANKQTFLEEALRAANEKLNSTLLIKGFASRAATIGGDIRAHALSSRAHLGINPKAIIIDMAETVKPSSDKRLSDWRAQGEIYLEARALGFEFSCPVILPDRCNRETVSRTVPSVTSFQGALEKGGHVDVALGLCSSDEEYLEHIIRYFIFLNRHGPAFQHFRGSVDPATMTMTVLEKIPWRPEDEEEAEDRRRNRAHRRGRERRAPLDRLD